MDTATPEVGQTVRLPQVTGARRAAWVVPVVLFVLAASLRCGLVTRQGLWVDEVFSLAIATGHSIEHPAKIANPNLGDYVEAPGPASASYYAAYARHDDPPASPSRVIRAVMLSDTSPPLYYLVLHYWTRLFGTGDVALRMLSVVCAMAAFPFLWSAARIAGGRNAAIAAGVLWSLLPLSLYNAVEGRMYGLLWLAAAANLWAALRLHQGISDREGEAPAEPSVPARETSWIVLSIWVLSGIVGLLTHYFFLFAWLPTCAWLVLYPGRSRRVMFIAAAILVGLAVLPWYVRVPAQLAAWRVTDGWLNWRPGGYSTLWYHLRMPYHFFAVSGPWGVRGAWDKINALAYVVLAVAALWWGRKAVFSPRWMLGWFIFAGTVVGLVLFDIWRRTYTGAVERYVAPGLPGAVLLAALALACLPRYGRVSLTIVIALTCLIATRRMYLNEGRIGQHLREMAGVLSKDAGSDDVVIVHSIPSGVTGLARYVEPRMARKGSPGFVSWVGQLKLRDVDRDMPAIIAGHRRVFLIRFHEVGAAMPEGTWLEQHAKRVRKLSVGYVHALVYEPTEGERFASTQPSTTRSAMP